MTCRVCAGRGTVRLPVAPDYAPTTMIEDLSGWLEANPRQPWYKDFPCPGCSPQAPAETVDLIRVEGSYLVERAEAHPEIVGSVRRKLATAIGNYLLENDLLTFTEEQQVEGPLYDRVMRVTGVAGVISKKHVATMQQRIEEHQHGFACEVAAEARKQIMNWGSQYGHRRIDKDTACAEISDAIKTVLDQRKKRKIT